MKETAPAAHPLHQPPRVRLPLRVPPAAELLPQLELEQALEWAEQVLAMVPCGERVRFTSSGTEATMMALRLARAYTGREHVVKLAEHFHGWHDLAVGRATAEDGVSSPRDGSDGGSRGGSGGFGGCSRCGDGGGPARFRW